MSKEKVSVDLDLDVDTLDRLNVISKGWAVSIDDVINFVVGEKLRQEMISELVEHPEKLVEALTDSSTMRRKVAEEIRSMKDEG